MVNSRYDELTVTSDLFECGGAIPIQYTGRGDDISPSLKLSEISEGVKSIAIIMDDLDVPLIGTYNHWVIWNIPVQNVIPEAIPHGTVVDSLGGAIQGNSIDTEGQSHRLLLEIPTVISFMFMLWIANWI